MQEQHLDLDAPQGNMPTFVVHPDGEGPFPVVVLYMDAPAIREELYDMARRIAGEGYYVMLPDLFYRFGIIRFPVRNDKTRAIWQTCMANMSNAEVMADTKFMLEFLSSQPAARGGKMACIGFCMSGRLVAHAAATFPDSFAVMCSMYGVGIVTGKDDSPHHIVKQITGEAYFAFAETDQTVPSYVIPTLRDALDTAGVNYKLDVWPGTHHGFSFASRDIYDHAASEASWESFFDMCKRQL